MKTEHCKFCKQHPAFRSDDRQYWIECGCYRSTIYKNFVALEIPAENQDYLEVGAIIRLIDRWNMCQLLERPKP